jgi:hypothetical protein
LPDPFTIEIGSAFAGFAPLEDEAVEDVVLELAPPPTAPDPATTTMVPTIVVECREQK